MAEDVDELAEKLLKGGIAHSESHAREMAEDISSTGKKVDKEYRENLEEATSDDGEGETPSDIYTDVDIDGVDEGTSLKDLMSDS